MFSLYTDFYPDRSRRSKIICIAYNLWNFVYFLYTVFYHVKPFLCYKKTYRQTNQNYVVIICTITCSGCIPTFIEVGQSFLVLLWDVQTNRQIIYHLQYTQCQQHRSSLSLITTGQTDTTYTTQRFEQWYDLIWLSFIAIRLEFRHRTHNTSLFI